MSSQFKKAHKLHEYAQRAGTRYPRTSAGGSNPLQGDDESQLLYRALCELVPDAGHRAALLGVEPETERAWQNGAGLPLLRASRTRLRRLLRRASVSPPQP